MPSAAPEKSPPRPAATQRLLQASFVLAVVSFAWLRFSDNTVDNDLWGHVLYGQRYWLKGEVRGKEMLSWTAPGFAIVNHEYLAEIVMGWVHRAAGGTGLWVYMLVMGFATSGFALRAGKGTGIAQTWTALILFAASINFIAVGFAVRPQLFTTLALVVELVLLRELVKGRLSWGWLLPPLIALWGNFHGGVLAGIVVFFIMAATESLQTLWPHPWSTGWDAPTSSQRTLTVYWTLFALSGFALLFNPWGYDLVKWNVGAILRPRPQIQEWHALNLSAAHAPFYVVATLTLLAWSFSRRPKKAWEAATLLVLATMGILHQRHVPLFGLANLIFSPRHFNAAAQRLAPHCRGLISALARPVVQAVVSVLLLVASGASLVASFLTPKEHPFTMEVEKNVYPVSAVAFMQASHLEGKTITFFDWGQENLWELPYNPVSFDGRFDTGYPPSVIAAHWDFYRGQALRPEVNWSEAEVALLPVESGGVTLLTQAGWRAVYRDPLATVLIPARGRHASFMAGQPPLQRGLEALRGRSPFPDAPPLLSTASAPR
jgi:hypothetical protein